MRIFITGGTGFIGKFVVKKLDNQRDKLLLLVRDINHSTNSQNVSFVEGNLASIGKWGETLEAFKPEASIHLAWEGIPDYGIEQSIKNLNYGLDLIKLLAKTSCCTILVTGSLWEYGIQTGKLSEDMPTKPFNAFTAAKNSLFLLGRELARENNIKFIWTRLFNVYGPGQKNTSLIPYLINCVKEKKEMEIRNPNNKNDFIYVGDVADAISEILLKCKKSEIFNIGSGKLISVQSIIDKIFNVFNTKQKYKKMQRKQTDYLANFYADISKIKREIGWQPKIDIDEGLRKTIESLL